MSTTTKYAPENFFTPGQLARQGVMDYLIITHGVKPLAKDFLPIADWVLHGGPTTYIDTLVEESGSGLIEEIYESLSEAAEQINEPEPEAVFVMDVEGHRSALEDGAKVSTWYDFDDDGGSTLTANNLRDHNWNDAVGAIARRILNPEILGDFKPVEPVPTPLAVAAIHSIDLLSAERDIRTTHARCYPTTLCEVLINPDDFKPVEDRPFEVGDRVIVAPRNHIATRWHNEVGTVVNRGYWLSVILDDSEDGLSLAPKELTHLAKESSNYTKAADPVNA